MRWQRIKGTLVGSGLDLLAGAVGGPAGAAASMIGRQIARELGVSTPEQVEEKIRTDPEAAKRLAHFEEQSSEQLALLMQEQTEMARILERDADKGFFHDGWRPAMMWLIGALWAWSMAVVPTLNALFSTGIPIPPLEILLSVTGIYMALYMGGHTALRALKERKGG